MHLSIVTTVYQSEDYILDFYSRITQISQVISEDNYEIIIVNDGSEDLSLSIIKEIHNDDSKVSIINLSRNFGHHRALMVGLEYACGDIIFLIDSDLEENPEELQRFYLELNKDKDIDVVYGVQEERKGKFLEKISGKIFYKLFNLLSDTANIPENLSTVRIMRRAYVEALLSFKDKEIYFAPLANLAGFKQKELTIKKGFKKKTTYNFSKKYHLFINSIFSYTSKPLYLMFYIGSLVTLFSFSYLLYLIIGYFLYGVQVSGWASTIVSIWFFGGLTILFLGIISIYISKIYTESKNRPNYIVKEFLEGKERKSSRLQ